ncbi:hypothetical protein EVJ58_g463 [Rhodofomes roseus]|uniref:Fucose-specific lectin n=1 Tax=Rhodofomes roseus TaxID=34475 RepID=A0A4Y9Z6E2_9APHY|nr:hypothetical protein EVJ58_g463 [Rhodofomes roseus]
MSQLQELARRLTSAGYALHPEGTATYTLNTDDGSVVLMHWTGDSVGSEELITTSARAGSTAAYIPTPDGGIVACITDSSTVAVLHYDEDEEEWVEADGLPQCEVDPNGQLVACLDSTASVVVAFQNDAGDLICLQESDEDESWTTTEIQGARKPAAGTPLSIRIDFDSLALQVFYIAESDGAVHGATRLHGATLWEDTVVLPTGGSESLKRLLVMNGPNGAADYMAYALTSADNVVQLTAGEAVNDLGHVGKDGVLVPSTTAECCMHIFGLVINLNFSLTLGVESKKRRFFR